MITSKKINFFWLFPIIALFIGVYLAYDKVSQLGDIIEIHFDTAEGLEVGKTKIRYKNLDVGTITEITLADNLNEVIVKAQMNKSANKLLKKDSEFWIVKPKVSMNGILGLSTILSGSYIAISAGKSELTSKKFIALKDMPLIEKNEKGIRINLITENLSGLNIGSSIYYHGMKVGQIEKINFNESFEHLILSVFIYAPYHELITPDTHFWNMNGIKLNLGSQGASIEMNSFESLILGGISFSTPASLIKSKNTNVEQMYFPLFKSENEMIGNAKSMKEYFVAYFPDSVRGLKTGAPVNFNGIDIGRVSEIRLIYDTEDHKAKIPVLIELEPEKITNISDEYFNVMNELVSSGLSASLSSGNLITGDKFVKLSVNKKEQNKPLQIDKYSKYLILPTVSGELNRITDEIDSIMNRIKQIPLENIVNNIELITANINSLSKNFDKEVILLMKNYGALAKSIERELNKMSKGITLLSEQLIKILINYSANSSFYFTLEKTLNALEKAARNFDKASGKFKDKPNSIIFGE